MPEKPETKPDKGAPPQDSPKNSRDVRPDVLTSLRYREQNLNKHQPKVSRVIKQNIRTIIRYRQQHISKRSTQERIADAITEFSGSMAFVYLHITWFAVWVLFNTGRFGIAAFDPFPYGLLTMVVSLEAIFLATFVLISQNRLSKENEESSELDLQINLLTERELTRVLLMLDAIQDKMGIENDLDIELADLEKETKPEEVLKEIERRQNRTVRKK